MFELCFQCDFRWNWVKYAITIAHVCFIALTHAGSLRRCLDTLPSNLMFKQLSQDLEKFIYLTAKETHIIQYQFNTRNPYQNLP